MSFFFRSAIGGFNPKTLALLLCVSAVAGCAIIPRGAGVQQEILKVDNDQIKEFAVYPVTKNFLPVVQSWPATGTENSAGWVSHKHGTTTSVIKPGDRLDLVIWDSESNSLLTSDAQKAVEMTNIVVSPSGTIFLPYLNTIKVSGNNLETARRKIQGMMEDIIPSAQVQMSRTQGYQNMVDLVGGVSSPGSYPITTPHFTVLNLISQGGGVSTSLRNPRVRLNRNGKSYVQSLSSIYADPSLDALVRGGDKLVIEQDKRYFLSLGAAGKESLVYFEKESITALDAMALVGGVSDGRGNPRGILILREYPSWSVKDGLRGPGHTRSIFTLDITNADGLFSAGKFTINSKDTVLVTESPLNSAQTIFGLIGSLFGLANTASSAGN